MLLVRVAGGTAAGSKKPLAFAATKDWNCPGCGARCKFYWTNCPNCGHRRPT